MNPRTPHFLFSSNPVKRFKIEQLLGREPILLEDPDIYKHIHGRKILITGASGSIGSELAKQIALQNPSELILLDRSEATLTALERNLKKHHKGLNINVQLADVADDIRIRHIFETVRPNTVYHAAALKHVPFVEKQQYDAIKTNILGTKLLADISAQTNVDKFVYVSTDKAVNPSSVMGATKRFGEMIMATRPESCSTQFITARFGNVLGSSGSVVNLFEDQILCGGPVTITHKDMVRYFMTPSEAGQLLLQAGAKGEGGQVLIFKMGDPVFIIDLALKMIGLHGLKPYSDIGIEFTGARPGEKFYEELLGENETLISSPHPKIIVAALQSIPASEIEKHVKNLKLALLGPDMQRLSEILSAAVSGFHVGKHKEQIHFNAG